MRPLQTRANTLRPIPGRAVCGGVKTPPYNARQTPYKPVTGNRRVLPHRKPNFFERPQAAEHHHFSFFFFNFSFSKPFLRCFFNNVPHSNSRRLAGRRGGRITAIPGEVGFAGGAAVSAPPRHFPCPHKAAAAVRVYVLLAGRTPARVNLRVLRPLPHRGAAYSAVSAVAEAGFSARKASTWACASAMTSWKPAAFSSSTIWATIVSGSEPPQEPVSSSLL